MPYAFPASPTEMVKETHAAIARCDLLLAATARLVSESAAMVNWKFTKIRRTTAGCDPSRPRRADGHDVSAR